MGGRKERVGNNLNTRWPIKSVATIWTTFQHGTRWGEKEGDYQVGRERGSEGKVDGGGSGRNGRAVDQSQANGKGVNYRGQGREERVGNNPNIRRPVEVRRRDSAWLSGAGLYKGNPIRGEIRV